MRWKKLEARFDVDVNVRAKKFLMLRIITRNRKQKKNIYSDKIH